MSHVMRQMGPSMDNACSYVAAGLANETRGRTSDSTGKLSRSWRQKWLQRTTRILRKQVYSKVIYARLQNAGGIIKPVNRSALTIPLTAEAKKRKAPSFNPKLHRRGSSLWQTKGKGGNRTSVMHFALVDQVKIPAKNYIERVAKRDAPKVQQMLRRDLKTILRGGIP